MSWHVTGDQCKVRIEEDKYNFGPGKNSREFGILVELPKKLHWLGYHSFAFEESFVSAEKLDEILAHFKKYLGKPVMWEMQQDRGRKFKEGDATYVYLKLTDVIGYADSEADMEEHEADEEVGKSGSFVL